MDETNRAFVQSTRVKIEDVVPGMILAESVKNELGATIIPEDTKLTREQIEHLRSANVSYVYIEIIETAKEFDPLRGKTAVVVDDSMFFRHMFSKMLYRMGIHVSDETETAERAIEVALKHPPDLIVMDIHLPKMSGNEAIRRLKSRLPEAKFVAVSSDQDRRTVIEALQSGANDFIVKPVKWESLHPRIQKLFADRQTLKAS